jgi:hypothetical protein
VLPHGSSEAEVCRNDPPLDSYSCRLSSNLRLPLPLSLLLLLLQSPDSASSSMSSCELAPEGPETQGAPGYEGRPLRRRGGGGGGAGGFLLTLLRGMQRRACAWAARLASHFRHLGVFLGHVCGRLQ